MWKGKCPRRRGRIKIELLQKPCAKALEVNVICALWVQDSDGTSFNCTSSPSKESGRGKKCSSWFFTFDIYLISFAIYQQNSTEFCTLLFGLLKSAAAVVVVVRQMCHTKKAIEYEINDSRGWMSHLVTPLPLPRVMFPYFNLENVYRKSNFFFHKCNSKKI